MKSSFDKLSILGKELLLETLPSIFDGTNSRTAQNKNEITFAYNLKREEELNKKREALRRKNGP